MQQTQTSNKLTQTQQITHTCIHILPSLAWYIPKQKKHTEQAQSTEKSKLLTFALQPNLNCTKLKLHQKRKQTNKQ